MVVFMWSNGSLPYPAVSMFPTPNRSVEVTPTSFFLFIHWKIIAILVGDVAQGAAHRDSACALRRVAITSSIEKDTKVALPAKRWMRTRHGKQHP